MLESVKEASINPISKVKIFAKGFSISLFYFSGWIDGCFCERKLGFNGSENFWNININESFFFCIELNLLETILKNVCYKKIFII